MRFCLHSEGDRFCSKPRGHDGDHEHRLIADASASPGYRPAPPGPDWRDDPRRAFERDDRRAKPQ